MAASACIFGRVPMDWFGDFHPTPRRQIVITLSGALEIITSDGESRRIGPETVLLLEDVNGKGHSTRVIGTEPYLVAVIALAS